MSCCCCWAEPEQSIVVAGGVRAGTSTHKHEHKLKQKQKQTSLAASRRWGPTSLPLSPSPLPSSSCCFCCCNFPLFLFGIQNTRVPLPLCKRAGRQLNRSCSSSSIESCCIAIGFTLVNSFSDLVIPHSASQLGGGGNVEAGRAQTCLPHHHQQLDHPTQQYQ